MKRPGALFSPILFFVVLLAGQQAFADKWTQWERIPGSRISWHYQWDSAWKDYNIEIRSDYDTSMTVKFVLSCGKEKSVGYWSLKAGAKATFLQKFEKGGADVPIRLQILDSYSN